MREGQELSPNMKAIKARQRFLPGGYSSVSCQSESLKHEGFEFGGAESLLCEMGST
ncbi:hypothetical protein RchiOBHm_Chr4g0426141 [Rosa chinensis]|uniref:Uncharacterized protein n=1 Tax=Rosa chinensis TaxID=74649 RepID=A0A2P6QZB1_ROSCH|nr:hypothetical protein RchiOBHm_Chr4g0426141 [Rosa chinensis]